MRIRHATATPDRHGPCVCRSNPERHAIATQTGDVHLLISHSNRRLIGAVGRGRYAACLREIPQAEILKIKRLTRNLKSTYVIELSTRVLADPRIKARMMCREDMRLASEMEQARTTVSRCFSRMVGEIYSAAHPKAELRLQLPVKRLPVPERPRFAGRA